MIGAGLAVAPSGAIAGPSEPDTLASDASGPRLGVLVTELTPELRVHFGAGKDRGVLVARVEPFSAASGAGIEVGDVIVDVRGETVDEARDIVAALGKAKRGDHVRVQVIRNRAPVSVQAKVSEASAMLDLPWLRGFFHRSDTT